MANENECTATLLLDIDSVALSRGRGVGDGSPLAPYVNDRPYVASSFMSVAIARVFRTALRGTHKDHAELAQTALPLKAELPVLPCRGGESFLRALFEPLGYGVTAQAIAADETFPSWGGSAYFSVTLAATCTLQSLLTHLYVLLPVLDNEKHYWVGQDELEKLLAHGEGWLAEHPAREQIISRYLRRQRVLMRQAVAQLVADDDPRPELAEVRRERVETALERPLGLNEQRIATVVQTLEELGARQVLDLGCGEGRLVQSLLKKSQFSRLVGVDVSMRCLESAALHLDLARMPEMQRARVDFFQGALTYRDERFQGFDAACAIEVIEHLDSTRLPAFTRVVFEFARPTAVVITTPNAEYNALFASLPVGQVRHPDHRFEWTRAEFAAWAHDVAQRFGYTVRLAPVGPEDQRLGAPTQMAVFTQ